MTATNMCSNFDSKWCSPDRHIALVNRASVVINHTETSIIAGVSSTYINIYTHKAQMCMLI